MMTTEIDAFYKDDAYWGDMLSPDRQDVLYERAGFMSRCIAARLIAEQFENPSGQMVLDTYRPGDQFDGRATGILAVAAVHTESLFYTAPPVKSGGMASSRYQAAPPMNIDSMDRIAEAQYEYKTLPLIGAIVPTSKGMRLCAAPRAAIVCADEEGGRPTVDIGQIVAVKLPIIVGQTRRHRLTDGLAVLERIRGVHVLRHGRKV